MSSPGEEQLNYYREQGKEAALESLVEQLEGMLEVKSHADPTRSGYEFALELVKSCQS